MNRQMSIFRPFNVAILVIVSIFSTFLFTSQSNAQSTSGGEEFVPNQVIIKTGSGVNINDIGLLSDLNAVVAQEFSATGAQLLQLPNGTDIQAIVEQYAGNQSIEYIEPNYVVSIAPPEEQIANVLASQSRAANATPNDPNYADLWGMHNTSQTGGTNDADIDAAEAWDLHKGDGTVVVAVIDTGVDYTHPDLTGNMWTNPGETAGNGVDDDGNGFVDDIHGYDFCNNDGDPFDDNNHGTHVAGTIGAVGDNNVGVVGVNWDVQIMGVKFLCGSGSGSIASAISAVEYATQMGAKLSNNSWGCSPGFCNSAALNDAIDAADAAGVLFVSSAGNSDNDNDATPSYPASYTSDNIISVAATDHNDARASFSSYGATTVDLGAPGVAILSTVPGNGYSSFNGTSMASPHVAGAAALLWSYCPNLTHMEVKNTIMSSVDSTGAMNGTTLSGGRLNIDAMLQACNNVPSTNLTIPSNIAATTGQTVTVPVQFTSGVDQDITSLTFSIDYDHTCLSFDPTDSDLDDVPDSITLNIPNDFAPSIVYDAADTDGEIDIAIFDALAPLASLPDGAIATIEFMATCDPGEGATTIAPITFSPDPAASFGSTTGAGVDGTTTDGSVEIFDDGSPLIWGDCNGDNQVDAGDISAEILEIFDGDGTDASDTPNGSFPGNNMCDSNEDTKVDAADIACTVLVIFNGQGACGVSQSRTGEARTINTFPTLSLIEEETTLAAGKMTLPVTYIADGHEISSFIFSLDYPEDVLSFDSTDADGDGVPDSVVFNTPAAFRPTIDADMSDTDGELDFTIADYAPPLRAMPDGTIAYVTFDIVDMNGAAAIRFSPQPAASFGSTTGSSVVGNTEDAMIEGLSAAGYFIYLSIVNTN